MSEMAWKFWKRQERPSKVSGHAALSPGEIIYAVGDIHGCADLLNDLLAAIARDAAGRRATSATVIFLGDYIDRGPDSRGVIERLAAGPDFPARYVFLKGNHEAMILNFLANPASGSEWRQFGGLETLASYGVDIRDTRLGRGLAQAAAALAAALPSRHLSFLQSLKLTASSGDFFFCHAGVKPGVPLHRQVAADLMWIRDEFIDSAASHGAIVVHGHTPVLEPDRRSNRINVDTGAYLTGQLSCAVIDGDGVTFLSAGSRGGAQMQVG
jgi:serine/threonine protein phosphatase 1